MQRSGIKLHHLAAAQAIIAAIIVGGVAVRVALGSPNTWQSGQAIVVAGVGVIVMVYYFTAHRALRANHERVSTLALMALSSLNIAFIISITGGLDSPYYSVWLFGILLFGLVSIPIGGGLLGITLLAYLIQYAETGFNKAFIVSHVGQAAITVAVFLMAAWVHRSIGLSGDTDSKLQQLSGQLEGELSKSELIMNSVGEGILVVDTNRQVQLFNKAATAITGWDAKSAQGIDYRLVMGLTTSDGTKVDDNTDPFAECYREDKNLIVDDLMIETKGGHGIPITLSLSPIKDRDGNITGGIGLFRDSSADKEIDRQRDEFISTASHEMRTPVAAIEGYLSLAMTPTVATIDDRAKGYLEKAHASTQHLGELFRDLLSTTKLEDNPQLDKREPIDLGAMLTEVVSDMQFTAQKKGLKLTLESEGLKSSQKSIMPIYTINASQQRMREVISNLVENGLKFTKEGGVTVSIHGEKDTVTVSITDTGVGISPEDAGHLFQKFYRVDSSATRTIGGTGLGLYLCRTIIENLGGRIWIESELGHGASFKFTLPLMNAAEVPAQAPVPKAEPAAEPAAKPEATPAAAPTPAKPTIAPAKVARKAGKKQLG